MGLSGRPLEPFGVHPLVSVRSRYFQRAFRSPSGLLRGCIPLFLFVYAASQGLCGRPWGTFAAPSDASSLQMLGKIFVSQISVPSSKYIPLLLGFTIPCRWCLFQRASSGRRPSPSRLLRGRLTSKVMGIVEKTIFFLQMKSNFIQRGGEGVQGAIAKPPALPLTNNTRVRLPCTK